MAEAALTTINEENYMSLLEKMVQKNQNIFWLVFVWDEKYKQRIPSSLYSQIERRLASVAPSLHKIYTSVGIFNAGADPDGQHGRCFFDLTSRKAEWRPGHARLVLINVMGPIASIDPLYCQTDDSIIDFVKSHTRNLSKYS